MSILNSVIDSTIQQTTVSPAENLLAKAIRERLAQSQSVIDHVQNNVPQDRLLRTAAVTFRDDADLTINGGTNGGSFTAPLTRHALGQAASRVGFPASYAADVMAEKGTVGREVVARALTTLYAAEPTTRKMLVRSVNGKVHGIMSDAYRRLDSRPGVDAFIGAVSALGAVPYGGVVTDTRVVIKAILPRVFVLGSQRTDGHGDRFHDAIALGLSLSNSDFGAGTYKLNLYVERVLCLNGMIGEAAFAQRHLGARLEEGDFYSERTHRLDSATMVSATKDYVKAILSPEGVEKTVAILQNAATTKLDLEAEINSVLKKTMTKEEIKGLTAALQSVNEDEMPLGPPTPWRMANAISWLAGKAEDADRSVDLQRMAGKYLRAA